MNDIERDIISRWTRIGWAGGSWIPGSPLHLAVESFHIGLFPTTYAEVRIPVDGGRVDLLDPTSGAIYEIKPFGGEADAINDLREYLNVLPFRCPGPIWRTGSLNLDRFVIAIPSLFKPLGYTRISIEYKGNGAIIYTNTNGSPIIQTIPTDVLDDFKRQVSRWYNDLKNGAIITESVILEWLENNEKIANFLVDFGTQIVIAILVINTLENLVTFGSAVADDPLVYALVTTIRQLAVLARQTKLQRCLVP